MGIGSMVGNVFLSQGDETDAMTELDVAVQVSLEYPILGSLLPAVVSIKRV
jgi:hypothetical protein